MTMFTYPYPLNRLLVQLLWEHPHSNGNLPLPIEPVVRAVVRGAPTILWGLKRVTSAYPSPPPLPIAPPTWFFHPDGKLNNNSHNRGRAP